jgi:dihydroorotate dehydrogenase (NAD+) catalytic subunit
MGGIECGRHVIDFVAAGASAVALGTKLFSDPFAARRIRAELIEEATTLEGASAAAMARKGITLASSPGLSAFQTT